MFSSSRNPVIGSLFIGLALLGAAGCEEAVSSENIRTPGISMATMVTAGPSSAKVKVTLTVGGDESNTKVLLMAGDELVAFADGDEKTMTEVANGEYEVSFDAVEEDTMYEVHLLRENDEDAKGNGGELPAPFAITSDLEGEYSRVEDDIEITWDPSDSGDDMKLEVSDDDNCITATDRFDPSGDDGVYTIEAGELDGANDDDTCEAQVNVIREREGVRAENLDPESTFFLRQVRSTSFETAP
jgi:hypothetical protein